VEVAPGFWKDSPRIILSGKFSNGRLQGPVQGINEKGSLCFVGIFKNGTPSGQI